MLIRRLNGEQVQADYVRHLRTMTARNGLGGSNLDLDLFRVAKTGEEIQCMSPDDARAVPEEVAADWAPAGYS